MIKDIATNLDIIEKSLVLAEVHKKDTFKKGQFKESRRKLKNIKYSLEENCSIAAYGQSQVGKSYLINSLLSSSSQQFMIENEGTYYSFLKDINCSALRTNEVESTGLITRFTCSKPMLSDMVRVRNLSIADIVLILIDSYYKDIRSDVDSISTQEINQFLDQYKSAWMQGDKVQSYIAEDDIYDIEDYLENNLRHETIVIRQSTFFKDISNNIEKVPVSDWVELFSLLWNKNEKISQLFGKLINEYSKFKFENEIFLPFDSVLFAKGTILDIRWLDLIVSGGVLDNNPAYESKVSIYNKKGQLLCADFSKAVLAALIAEITFYLPEDIKKDRPFLEHMDLLDFPGARSRSSIEESAVGDTVIPLILRRGKVAYLFNKYSTSERISSILFCHHHNQTSESTVANSVSDWVRDNIGSTIDERTVRLKSTNGISPLFLIATKFNKDLEKQAEETPSRTASHWARFDTVYPEILKGKSWYDSFCKKDGRTVAFQNIYPIRSFSYSSGVLFDGYSEIEKTPEKTIHIHSDFPNYLEKLQQSFLKNEEIQKHFESPEETWNDVATVNNDGSKKIILKLNEIAPRLATYRKQGYLEKLIKIKNDIQSELSRYYVSENIEDQHRRLKDNIRSVRIGLSKRVGDHPELFGRIIDKLMIPAGLLHNEAYEIYTFHSHAPVDLSEAKALCMSAGINLADDYSINVQKLKEYSLIDDDDELQEYLKQECNLTIEQILTPSESLNSTMAGVVTEQLVLVWFDYLNNKTRELSVLIDKSDEVVKMIEDLFVLLNVKKKLFDRIKHYESVIDKQYLHIPVGDLAATFFNDFVSTVGNSHYDESARNKVLEVSQLVHVSPSKKSEEKTFSSMEEALRNLPAANDQNQLQKQPFWNHFSMWESRLEEGLILTSDVQNCNIELNGKLHDLIQQTENLYSNN